MWSNFQDQLKSIILFPLCSFINSIGVTFNWSELTALGMLKYVTHLTFRILICLMVTFAFYHV